MSSTSLRRSKARPGRNPKTAICILLAFLAGFGAHLHQGLNIDFMGCILDSPLAHDRDALSTTQAAQKESNETITDTPIDSNLPYTWMGNHWVPPPGVPTYGAAQLQEIFSRHNVLFLGDSTMRRTFLTLFEMINTTRGDIGYLSNHYVSSLENPRVIDLNKRGMPIEECGSNLTTTAAIHEVRDRNPNTNSRGLSFPKVGGSRYFCRRLSSAATKDLGKMDHASTACMQDAYRFVLNELGECDKKIMMENCQDRAKNDTFRGKRTIMSSEYTVIVFGMGIWDGSVAGRCRDPYGGLDTLQRTLNKLETLSKQLGGLPIIWRTSGHRKDNSKQQRIDMMNKMVMDHFQNPGRDDNSMVSVVDFGRDIKPRSFGNNRIDGDLQPHYGLEARLMWINMIAHRIVIAEHKQRRLEKL